MQKKGVKQLKINEAAGCPYEKAAVEEGYCCPYEKAAVKEGYCCPYECYQCDSDGCKVCEEMEDCDCGADIRKCEKCEN